MKFRRTFLSSSVMLAGLLVIASPAHAQRSSGPGGQQSSKPTTRAPALPGTKTDKPTPAPATKPSSEMNPTDALFDGINRGDVAAVKDAINRGADLDSRNLLGLSPMELSVDLGQHEISFLLLSLRDSMGSGPRSGPPSGPKAGNIPAKPVPPEPVAKMVHVPPPSPYPTANKFSHDGGAAVPDKGFLGFAPRQ